MNPYAKRGHIDIKVSKGAPIRIMYIHEDKDRTEYVFQKEVEVIRAFVEAYNRGDAVSLMTIIFEAH